MLKRLVVLFGALCVTSAVAQSPPAPEPDECLPKPKYDQLVQGGWHYHELHGKRCWYVRAGTSTANTVRVRIHRRWTGPYFGANVGYGFTVIGIGPKGWNAPTFAGIVPPETVSQNGPLVGVQSGYRWRTDKLVLGVENQFDYLNFMNLDLASARLGKVTWTNDTFFNVGYVVNPSLLVYGGVALSEANKDTIDLWTGKTDSTQLWGGAFQTGFEVALNDSVTTGARYKFQDFGGGTVVQAVLWDLNVTLIEVNGGPSLGNN
jgi:opacity protein-like surface antigen